MAKSKTSFFCQSCGTQYAKWVGQCNSCKAWNTVVEELIQTNTTVLWGSKNQVAAAHPVRVEDITLSAEQRLDSLDEEFNRVLGGGIVPGSLVLIGGEPGVGKSTLMLQIALTLPHKVLYVSGEESLKQLKMRAERIHAQSSQCYILTETHTESILKQAETMSPDLVVIDSIQTLHTTAIESSPGSVSQIRACTAELIQYAKHTHTPVLLIGHITKDGFIAGPKVLEHMVDVVLQFEGDRDHAYRLLRPLKNRFGSEAYAAEELVAELSSAILGAELGLPVTHLDHHASYIASWLKLLRSDDRAILTAAAKAEEAASLLMRLGGLDERQSSEDDNELEQAA